MNILFSIAGRAGSKGIPGKNLRDFLGEPLALYSLSAIDLFIRSAADDGHQITSDIVLNTDSEELIKIFENQNIREVSVVKRNPELAGDEVSKMLVLRNSLGEMMKKTKQDYDMLIDFDITSPLRTVSDVKNLFEAKLGNDYDCVFSVTEARRNPYFNQVAKDEDGYYKTVFKSRIVARQYAPEILDMNGSLYAHSPEFILKNDYLFDGRCGIIKMRDTGILDLDHETDFETMEIIANFLYKKYPEYNEVRENVK